jgi:myo-inositol catabolism protein IolS
MKYRQLGKTGLKTSVVGVGTWQFGGEWGQEFDRDTVARLLGRAKGLGINLIDTAECYGDHLSEELIGAFLKQDRREDWIIATKFGHKFHSNFERTDHWSPEEVVAQLEASLRALGTDYVDVYQFHSGSDEAFDQDALWEALNAQVDAGKIRHLGISIRHNDDTYQTAHATDVGASVIQVIYNRLDRTPEEKVLPSCQQQNLGVLARVPLASGYLSGKYQPGDTFTAPNDVRSLHNDEKVQRKLQQVQAIQQSEVPEGVAMAPWALAWCLQHPAVTCVIPGCKTVEQVTSNASAADLDLVRADHPQASA